MLTQRVDPSANGGDMLTQVQIQAFDEGGVNLPTPLGQHLPNGFERADHHAVFDPNDEPTPVRFHHLRIEQPGLWYPAWFGRWAFALAPFRLHPLAKVRQDGTEVILIAVSEKEWEAVGR